MDGLNCRMINYERGIMKTIIFKKILVHTSTGTLECILKVNWKQIAILITKSLTVSCMRYNINASIIENLCNLLKSNLIKWMVLKLLKNILKCTFYNKMAHCKNANFGSKNLVKGNKLAFS